MDTKGGKQRGGGGGAVMNWAIGIDMYTLMCIKLMTNKNLLYNKRKKRKKRHLHPSVHCSTIYNSQDMEATLMSINRGMDKEDVVHICNGILLSHKKEQNWVICRDMMDLETE